MSTLHQQHSSSETALEMMLRQVQGKIEAGQHQTSVVDEYRDPLDNYDALDYLLCLHAERRWRKGHHRHQQQSTTVVLRPYQSLPVAPWHIKRG